MRRGDLAIASPPGACGEPRPVLVVQADACADLASVTILPLTSDLRDAPAFRVDVEPTPATGLRAPSQIMIDKATTIPRDKLGPPIGRLEDDALLRVTQALALFLGLS